MPSPSPSTKGIVDKKLVALALSVILLITVLLFVFKKSDEHNDARVMSQVLPAAASQAVAASPSLDPYLDAKAVDAVVTKMLSPDNPMLKDGDALSFKHYPYRYAFANWDGSPSSTSGELAGVIIHSELSGTRLGVIFENKKVLHSALVESNAITPESLLASFHNQSLEPTAVADLDSVYPVTSMWLWGNPLVPENPKPGEFYRERNNPETEISEVVKFAKEQQLKEVYFNVEWAANEGEEYTNFLSSSVNALHAAGFSVSALGGEYEWVDNPELMKKFVTDALAAADFDRVELNIEPWAGPGTPSWETDMPSRITQMIESIRAAKSAAGDVPVDISLPYWLAEKPYGDQSAFEAIMKEVDHVAIVAFSNTATGPEGVIGLAQQAVDQAVNADKLFTVGVETDTPLIAGGSKYTFYAKSREDLEAELLKIHEAFSSLDNYRGITVEHYIAWRNLIK